MESSPTSKRPHHDNVKDGPPAKKAKGVPEFPTEYSDAVRKKLASGTRTGQACDRCKERKMKCDADAIACAPCRSKGLQCLTTDRVTGRPSERGQVDRVEQELQALRRRVTTYQRKYGPLDDLDLAQNDDLEALQETSPSHTTPHPLTPSFDLHSQTSIAPQDLHCGPINGTKINLIEDEIDIASFPCDDMQDYDPDIVPVYTNSRTSMLNSMCGAQKIKDQPLPPRDEAFASVKFFLKVIWPYTPIVHQASFLDLTAKFYDSDSFKPTPAEKTCLFMVLAIIAHQMAVRNHDLVKVKMEESNLLLHHALSSYRDLLHDNSLASMQALSLIVIHNRNLPKPGFSWDISHQILVRAISLKYHRSPDKIMLPESENNPLAKELRRRVFWTIFGVCVTIGTKLGQPAPWHFSHMDVEMPLPIQDAEISATGLAPNRSGKCDYWVALHLFKLLPLLTELYNGIIAVRQPGPAYVRTVENLNRKIIVWQQQWMKNIAVEVDDYGLQVQTLFIETWGSEFQLMLHHPTLCTTEEASIVNRNLEICHQSSNKLLQTFHTLFTKFKAADFTWHSTTSYVLALGTLLYIYKERSRYEPCGELRLEAIKKEFRDWLKVMNLADLVLRNGNFLWRFFEQRIKKFEDDHESAIAAQFAGTVLVSRESPREQIKPELQQQQSSNNSSGSQANGYQNQVSPDSKSGPGSSNHIPQSPYARPESAPVPQYSSPPASYHYSQQSNINPSPYANYSSPALHYSPQVPMSLAPLLNGGPSDNGMFIPYSQGSFVGEDAVPVVWPHSVFPDYQQQLHQQ